MRKNILIYLLAILILISVFLVSCSNDDLKVLEDENNKLKEELSLIREDVSKILSLTTKLSNDSTEIKNKMTQLQAKIKVLESNSRLNIDSEPIISAFVNVDVIESIIDGEFSGFEYGTIFKLMNGQIWIQEDFNIYISISFYTNVLIYNEGGIYYMKVDGIEQAVQVKRLK